MVFLWQQKLIPGASFTNTEQVKKSTKIRAWVSNNIHIKLSVVIVNPCFKFNISLAKSQSKLGRMDEYLFSIHNMVVITNPCPNII